VVVLDVDAENRRLSLGHKQLEENPWDVFEGVFTLDSVHQGTIVGTSDKGVIVALPYGVEGFTPSHHVVKEDNSQTRIKEVLDFKVIEFNKESRKIVVSHSKVYQDSMNVDKVTEKVERKESEKPAPKKAAPKKVKEINVEKSTLGDLDVLANLKEDMEKSEKAAGKAKAKAATEEAKAPEEPMASEEPKATEEAASEEPKSEE